MEYERGTNPIPEPLFTLSVVERKGLKDRAVALFYTFL